jgi:hypothetical protein
VVPPLERRRIQQHHFIRHASEGESVAKKARGYSWQQATKENTIAQKHGAWSDRIVDPVARDLVGVVGEHVPYLADPSYEPAVWAWARAEARVLVLTKWLDEHGTLDENGVPRPALSALKDFERLASTARSRLGLDPLSRAQLGRDVTAAQVDLARLYAQLDEKEA